MKTPFKTLLVAFTAANLLLLPSRGLYAAENNEGSEDIQQMMSPEEFKAAGLEKLSSDELQKLNNWLHGFRETAVKTAETKAIKSGKMKPNLIVSRLAQNFGALGGRTLIRLEDGTVWRQANPGDHYVVPPGENLAVAVFKAGVFGYKMRIQGMQEFYVDSVSNPPK